LSVTPLANEPCDGPAHESLSTSISIRAFLFSVGGRAGPSSCGVSVTFKAFKNARN
jgi:hypothetical protein